MPLQHARILLALLIFSAGLGLLSRAWRAHSKDTLAIGFRDPDPANPFLLTARPTHAEWLKHYAYALPHQNLSLVSDPEHAFDPVRVSSLLPRWPVSQNADAFPSSSIALHSKYRHNDLFPAHTLEDVCVRFSPAPAAERKKNCLSREQLSTYGCVTDLVRDGRTTVLLMNEDPVYRGTRPFTMSDSVGCGVWNWETRTLADTRTHPDPMYHTPPMIPQWIPYAGYTVERHDVTPTAPYIPGTTVLTEALWHGVSDALHNFIVPLSYALDARTSQSPIDYVWIEHGCVTEDDELVSRDPNHLQSLHRVFTYAAMAAYAPHATLLTRACTAAVSQTYCFERLIVSNYDSDWGRHPGGDALVLFGDADSERWAKEHVQQMRHALKHVFRISTKRMVRPFQVLVYYREDAANGRRLRPGNDTALEQIVREVVKRDMQFTHWHTYSAPATPAEARRTFQVFHDVDLLITPHGSVLANVMFMRKGARVWEVSSFTWIQSCAHGDLCVKLGLRCCLATHPTRLGKWPDTTPVIDSELHVESARRCWLGSE